MKKLKVILMGAGKRGIAYADIMAGMPEQFEVIAVAEPIDSRREYIKNLHHIPDNMCFTDYKPLLELGKIADMAVISTMDRDHFEPAMKAISLKYDLLLEKPICPTAEECVAINRAANENGVRVVICTVLRYAPVFTEVKQIIDSGKIGEIVSINHEECVGFMHYSHSFVRGNWGNSDSSSGMLLQKSCHDIDLLQWLIGKKCLKVQSFGSLTHFIRENAPEGSTEYCIDGCPHAENCRFNAVKVYLEDKNDWLRVTSTKLAAPTDEDVERTIRTTQYGKCVYKCDNNIVDHQTVNMLFEDDVTVTFSMNPFNDTGRNMHIMGTKGSLLIRTRPDKPSFHYDFPSETVTELNFSGGDDSIVGGHGGGDQGIIKTLYSYLTKGENTGNVPTIEESYYNHILVFAAEKSRETNSVVDIDEFIKSFN